MYPPIIDWLQVEPVLELEPKVLFPMVVYELSSEHYTLLP